MSDEPNWKIIAVLPLVVLFVVAERIVEWLRPLSPWPNTMTNEPDWKVIALYLADCHAATTEGAGRADLPIPSSAKRLRRICARAARLIEGTEKPLHLSHFANVTDRLKRAAKEPTP